MYEIILSQKNNQILASSLEVSDRFGKRHDHIMRSIDDLKKDVPNFGEMFFEDSYLDSYGRYQRNYYLNRDGFSLLVMGFTGSAALEWKLKYIAAFNAMEKQISTLRVPQTFAEALRLAADQQEIIEKNKPLVAFAETCAKSDTSVLVRELAKIVSKNGITIGEHKLWQKLRDWEMVFGKKNEPYQEYVDRGYFEVSQGVHENSKGTFLHKTTRILPKGQQYIIDRLKKDLGGISA